MFFLIFLFQEAEHVQEFQISNPHHNIDRQGNFVFIEVTISIM